MLGLLFLFNRSERKDIVSTKISGIRGAIFRTAQKTV